MDAQKRRLSQKRMMIPRRFWAPAVLPGTTRRHCSPLEFLGVESMRIVRPGKFREGILGITSIYSHKTRLNIPRAAALDTSPPDAGRANYQGPIRPTAYGVAG